MYFTNEFQGFISQNGSGRGRIRRWFVNEKSEKTTFEQTEKSLQMVRIDMEYPGQLYTRLKHESGTEIQTDAPVDNKGNGSSFSPTDLLASSLASCILTTICIRTGWDMSGSYAQIEKHMQAFPRRVGRIRIYLHLPAGLNEEQRKQVGAIASDCPVALSLHPDVNQDVQFIYDVC